MEADPGKTPREVLVRRRFWIGAEGGRAGELTVYLVASIDLKRKCYVSQRCWVVPQITPLQENPVLGTFYLELIWGGVLGR